MSVINQMLKDLEHRQRQDQNHGEQIIMPVSDQRRVPWGIILALFVTINFVAWYWFTQSQDTVQSKPLANQPTATTPTIESAAVQAPTTKTAKAAETSNIAKENSETKALVTAVTELLQQQKQVITRLSEQQQGSNNQAVAQEAATLSDDATEQTKEINNNTRSVLQPSIEKKAVTIEPKAELSITRVKLTTAELVQQKLAEAELAIQENKPKQAEQAYADVLLLAPEHIMARQKLAALWFGRKAFQPALNTLSQGLALLPDAYQFRFMQARIYLTQGLNAKALEVLLQQQTTDIDYLMMQAGLAQQLEQYNVAQASYLKVTQISPENAKAWLGYAIALDAQQQYSQALQAYQQTLSLAGLSAQNRQFVQQRSNELRN